MLYSENKYSLSNYTPSFWNTAYLFAVDMWAISENKREKTAIYQPFGGAVCFYIKLQLNSDY